MICASVGQLDFFLYPWMYLRNFCKRYMCSCNFDDSKRNVMVLFFIGEFYSSVIHVCGANFYFLIFRNLN